MSEKASRLEAWFFFQLPFKSSEKLRFLNADFSRAAIWLLFSPFNSLSKMIRVFYIGTYLQFIEHIDGQLMLFLISHYLSENFLENLICVPFLIILLIFKHLVSLMRVSLVASEVEMNLIICLWLVVSKTLILIVLVLVSLLAPTSDKRFLFLYFFCRWFPQGCGIKYLFLRKIESVFSKIVIILGIFKKLSLRKNILIVFEVFVFFCAYRVKGFVHCIRLMLW